MDENLVGYLFGCLDEAGTRQVEAYLHASPEARQKLARLKQALSPLAADRDEVAPPPGLVGRTLASVAEYARDDLPRAPREPSAPTLRIWWRRADVVIAATLLVFALGIASPVVYRWQRAQAKVACQSNLQEFFVGLTAYRDQHGAYPNLTPEAPRDVAGLIVPVLADAGVLPGTFTVRCPGVGTHLGCSLSVAGLRQLPEDEFQAQAPTLALCYAFTLGYRDGAGVYHTPWQLPDGSQPILADSPPADGALSNSVNHGGAGQNVLFLDGHFRFVVQRTIGDPDDDIYLNSANRVAAGLGPQDIVLGYSAARP